MRSIAIIAAILAASFLALPAQSNGGSNSFFRLFTDFAPTPRLFREADPEIEKKDYEVIKAILSNVENENLRFLFSVITNERLLIDSHIRRYTQPMSFTNTVYYYDSAARTMRKRDYLRLSIGEMERALERYAAIRTNLMLGGLSEAEANKTEFRLRRLAGLMHYLDGDPLHVKIAVGHFESIIGEVQRGAKEMANNDELVEVYTYLVSACHQVYADNANGDRSTALTYIRKELLYLWRYTELKNAGNDKLRDAKLMEVTRQYYPAMDLEGNDYIQIYKPFAEKLGRSYVPAGSSNTSSTNK